MTKEMKEIFLPDKLAYAKAFRRKGGEQMIEIKFNRQQLTRREKDKYAQVLKKIIAQVFQFNKDAKLLRDVARTELKIIFE